MRFTPNYSTKAEQHILDRPGVLLRLKEAALNGSITQEEFAHLKRDIDQFRRAEEGDRARPDLYSPERNAPSVANQHGLPTPYSGRETHRPDRLRDREAMARMRRISERLEAEQTAEALQKQMGTDADRPLPEVTLRDQIAAAMAVATEE